MASKATLRRKVRRQRRADRSGFTSTTQFSDVVDHALLDRTDPLPRAATSIERADFAPSWTEAGMLDRLEFSWNQTQAAKQGRVAG